MKKLYSKKIDSLIGKILLGVILVVFWFCVVVKILLI